MRHPLERVRFKKEPYGLRPSAITNVLEFTQRTGWSGEFDDTTAVVYLAKEGRVHPFALSDFEDVLIAKAAKVEAKK